MCDCLEVPGSTAMLDVRKALFDSNIYVLGSEGVVQSGATQIEKSQTKPKCQLKKLVQFPSTQFDRHEDKHEMPSSRAISNLRNLFHC